MLVGQSGNESNNFPYDNTHALYRLKDDEALKSGLAHSSVSNNPDNSVPDSTDNCYDRWVEELIKTSTSFILASTVTSYLIMSENQELL